MEIKEIIKNSEERIDYLRKKGDFKMADTERDWWISVGFKIEQTKLKTKILWK